MNIPHPLLSVQNLKLVYKTRRGDVKAVNDISFDINKNEVFGLAGESGCGKSTAAFAIAQLHLPPAEIVGGRLIFDNKDLLTMSPEELRSIRWNELSIVTQSAMNALNPVMTIAQQIIDVLKVHLTINKQDARTRVKELFDLVGIDPDRIDSYPHQLSGGMRQRAIIAMALALNPKLIIMDEPTTALDVVVQKQIMEEIRALKDKFNFSILFITHDLSLLVEFSDRIGIMYAGQLIEVAPSDELFKNPEHPYTEKLMHSFPTLFGENVTTEGIPGSPPNLITPPKGCKFNPRCSKICGDECRQVNPPLIEVRPGHQAACHLTKAKRSAV